MHHDSAGNGLDLAAPEIRTRGRPGREGLSGAWWLARILAAILVIAVLVIVNQGGSAAPKTIRIGGVAALLEHRPGYRVGAGQPE